MNIAGSGRYRWRIGPLVVMSLAITLLVGASAGQPVEPRILVRQDVPLEVTEAVDEIWQSFLATFPAQADCIGTVELVLVRELIGGDASYSPEPHLIRVEIPTTPVRFRESLAHELGHHLERVCGVVDQIGEQFIDAQGLDPSAGWYDGDPWYETATEHFAETAVRLIVGERTLHDDIVPISDEAANLVAEWGKG